MEIIRYLYIINRWKYILIASIVTVLFLTVVLLKAVSPVYMSEGKLWVKISDIQQRFVKDMPDEVGKFDFTDKDKAMGTIEELLESSNVVKKTIFELGLKNKDGEILTPEEFLNINVVGVIINKKAVQVENVSETETFSITGFSDDPAEAKAIVDRVLVNFLSVFSEIYRDAADKSVKVLTKRLAEIEANLASARKALSDYKSENGIFSISNQANTIVSEISTLEQGIGEVRRKIREGQDSLVVIKEALKKGDMIVENNPAIQNAKNQLISLEVEMAMMLTEKTQMHTDVIAVKNKIQAVNDFIAREINTSFTNEVGKRNPYYDELISLYTNTEIDITKKLAAEMVFSEQISRKQTELKLLPGKEEMVTRLQAKVDSLHTIYNNYSAYLETAETAKNMDVANVVVFQQPAFSEDVSENQYFPPKGNTIAIIIAFIVGSFFGFFLVFLAEHIDDGIWNSREIEEISGKNVIGTVPKVAKKSRNVANMQGSPLAEGAYNLIVNIGLLKAGKMGKSISFISPSKGDGKSTLAAFIAAAMAGQGRKVILVDANLRRPVLNDIFNVQRTPGLAECLSEGTSLKDVIHRTAVGNLDIVTAGSPLSHPQHHMYSGKLKNIIVAMAAQYDAVIIDTPAFEDGSDALAISKEVDDTILVVGQCRTSRAKTKDFMGTLNMSQINVLGVVMNIFAYRKAV